MIYQTLFIILGLLSYGVTQSLDSLSILAEKGELKKIKQILPKLKKKYPKDPGVLYYTGATMMDGESAVEIYREIIKKHSKSIYAEKASNKIGQYLYALGLYGQASKHLKKNIFRYPRSKDLSKTIGMMIRSYDATGELDSAQWAVNKFFKKFPNYYLKQSDLGYYPKSIRGLKIQTNKAAINEIANKVGDWMIQVGVFGVKQNAANLSKKLRASGYSVSVNSLPKNKSLFAVRVGPFESRKFAKEMAVELRNNFELDYQIIRQ